MGKTDKREKSSYGTRKYAINRDGDFYLTECPKCHNQDIHLDETEEKKKAFRCYRCKIDFQCYLEDGLVRLIDHRKGNAELPTIAVKDEACKIWRLGIEKEASWWWNRRELYQDLRKGKDAHQHHEYTILPYGEIEQNTEQQAEVTKR